MPHATTSRSSQGKQKPKQETHIPGLYAPFRALGYITADVPFSLQARGNDYFLTTCIGHSFQIYDASPRTKEPITALASQGDFTFTACGSQVYVFQRAKQVATLSHSTDTFTMSQLLILGDILFAVCSDNTLRMWNTTNYEFHNQLSFGNDFTISTVLHPSTYLNKILVASTQGRMQLWNFNSMRCVYTFPQVYQGAITCLAQSPVMDIVAIGTLQGHIYIHNIKTDQSVMSFQQESKVTSISFRTDDHHHMATADMQGDIALWDMDKKRLFHVIKGAHDGYIVSAEFLNGQPLLVTAGADNSVKQWIFDSIDGLPRLLKLRSGHHAPPTSIQYYDSEGKDILSVGRDRSLRLFSVFRDAQNVEFSQGSLIKKAKQAKTQVDELKLPQVVHFASWPAKSREWENVVTCHAQDHEARTWSFDKKAKGRHSFPTTDQSAAKCCAISYCGHFGLIGSAKGGIDVYNMQSGFFKRTMDATMGHTKAITGLGTDNLTRTVFSSSLDGQVKFWDFKTGKCMHSLDLESPISQMMYHHETGLLALVGDDLCIRVVDVDTRKIVRKFVGHRNRILDIAFSFDARWIVSTSLDSTIRTWDLPTGNLIDCFKTDSIATSITFSPSGDFLATSHVDQVGIFLWANKSQFTTVPIRPVSDEHVLQLCLPSASGETETVENDEEPIIYLPETHDTILDAQDIIEEMISLSSLPKSRWQTLLNIETIKKRNKPKEPVKAPEKAPFFLTTLPGTTPQFVDASKTQTAQESRVMNMGDMDIVTEFTRILRKCAFEENFEEFFVYLRNLTPSAADFELRSLSLQDDLKDFKAFIKAMQSLLLTHRDFDLVQTFMAVFLKIHGEDIIMNMDEELESILKEFESIHQESWTRMEKLLQYGLCMSDFIRLSI